MSKHRLTNQERETVLTRTKGEKSTMVRMAADENVWHVFSEIPKDVRRFTKLFGYGQPVGSHGGMEWEISVDLLRIQKKRKYRLSSEQKSELADRIARARASR